MLKVIFEDDCLLVFDKPAGLVVDKSDTQTEDTLEDLLKKHHGINLERAGIVHRLDKDTSGLLVVAKLESTLINLQNQFKQRAVKKEYLALVHGFLSEAGRIVGAVGRHPLKREKFTVLQNGKAAVTVYQPLKKLQMPNETVQKIFADFNRVQLKKLERIHYDQFTMLGCQPLTGRTHQIRVHLKYINHPVVADQKYAGRKIVRWDHRWISRQFLHAHQLEFNHPKTGQRMNLISKLPKDLTEALNLLVAI